MKDCCAPLDVTPEPEQNGFRKAVIFALIVNLLMFFVEIASGLYAGSLSLLADAIDFLGDAMNYGVTLFVLRRSMRWKAGAAIVKACCMIGFGVWVLWQAAMAAMHGELVPHAEIMGGVALLALLANLLCAVVLFRYRGGDSNHRSIWLCTRNDVIGNMFVMAAAGGVFATLTAWPDLLVASFMAVLALWSAWVIIRQAIKELRHIS